jgi:glutamyl-tRNA reductase
VNGTLSGVRVAHPDADRDTVAAAAEETSTAVADLLARPAVEEAFVLRTCHRVEAYVVTEDPVAGGRALATLGVGGESMDHEESLRHLLRVAAGLESMVLGEDQILGQVRAAYEEAREMDGVGPVLEAAVTKAIHVGERARTETGINEGVVSVGSAAVRLAAREIDHPLAASTALVVGAGEMGELAARALAERAGHVVVANRTHERAAALADDLPTDAESTGIDTLPARLAAADVVVTATGSPEPLVEPETAAAAGETTLVDLGQPADVAPGTGAVEGVTLFDLDDLHSVTDRTHERRREAVEAVERIVDAEFERLLEQFKRRRADEAIAAMYEGADRLKRRELQQAVDRLEAADSPAERRDIVEALADSLVSKLLAAPTRSLRDAAAEDDWETIHTALRLFDPEFDDAGRPSRPGPAETAADDD